MYCRKEWKRLRNKYLDLQKAKMKCLKHYMCNKWNRGTPARSQQSNGNVQEKEEPGKPMEKPRIAFTPGVIVHAVMEEPVMDIRKFKVTETKIKAFLWKCPMSKFILRL